jgi:hypothetical protein
MGEVLIYCLLVDALVRFGIQDRMLGMYTRWLVVRFAQLDFFSTNN